MSRRGYNNAIARRNQELSTAIRGKVTPKNADLILADISGSMDSEAVGGRRKYNCLQDALAPLKGKAHAIAFNSSVHEVDTDALPPPYGGTNMADALARANTLDPLHVLVISDGCPDMVDRTLEQARLLSEQCIIDTLYIGPSDMVSAIELMQEIARIGNGRAMVFDLEKPQQQLLGSVVDSLLMIGGPSETIKL